MTRGYGKCRAVESRWKARAFPQLLENADEAGVSHTFHSPCCYKQAVDIVQQPVLDVSGFCPRCPSQNTRYRGGEGYSIEGSRERYQSSVLLPS